MDLLAGQPFWPVRDGLPASYPSLDRNLRCRVAVVGAGITGALIAWKLAEAGIDAVVLDRREVAHGSTAGSTSLLQYEIDVPLWKLEKQLGPARAHLAYRDCLRAVREIGRLSRRLRIDCGYEKKGSLLLASSLAHVPRLQKEFVARKAAGFRVQWLDRAGLKRLGSLTQPAAILSANDEAAQVDAYALAHGLLRAAAKKGVRIFDRTAVTRQQTSSRKVELVTTGGFHVRADWLVVASGYEADRFLPEAVTTLHSTYAIATEPVRGFDGWPPGLPVIWETADPYIYLRTTADNRIIIGGYDEPFQDPRRRDRLLPQKVALLRRRLRQLFPAIPFDVAAAWTGTFGKTADGLPYIGTHPARPRTWFALGYGGNGITYSLIAAEHLREMLAGGRPAREELYGFAR